MFCADGALAFAKAHGIEEVPAEYLATEKSRQRLANYSQFRPSLHVEFYEKAKRLVKPKDRCTVIGELQLQVTRPYLAWCFECLNTPEIKCRKIIT